MERRGVAHAGARVPKMAIRCFWVAATPEFTTFLQKRNTCQGNAERLAALAYCCMGL